MTPFTAKRSGSGTDIFFDLYPATKGAFGQKPLSAKETLRGRRLAKIHELFDPAGVRVAAWADGIQVVFPRRTLEEVQVVPSREQDLADMGLGMNNAKSYTAAARSRADRERDWHARSGVSRSLTEGNSRCRWIPVETYTFVEDAS